MSFRILHTADWHLGKVLYEHELLEDQAAFLDQLLDYLFREKAEGRAYDAVVVSGDIYDTANPSSAAMNLLDSFYVKFAQNNKGTHLFIIKGNHDSLRVGLNKNFLKMAGIHLSAESTSITEPVVLEKDGEKLCVYQLPFLSQVNPVEFEGDEKGRIHSQGEMIAEACRQIKEAHEKNYGNELSLLSAHLTTFGSIKSAYDDNSVGTIDEVDSALFEPFDYTALGHIHKLQKCGKTGRVWYSGSPLPYYFDSSNETFFLDLTLEKGKEPVISKVAVDLLHKVERLEGKISEYLSSDESFINLHKDNYLEFIYTDEVLEPNAITKLKKIFPLALSFRPKSSQSRRDETLEAIESRQSTFNDPSLYFDAFFKENFGDSISDPELHQKAKELFITLAGEIDNPETDDFELTGED